MSKISYTPINYTADELLLKIGFESSNRGYVLYRSKFISNKENVDRIHAITDDGIIDLHEDIGLDGKHITQKSGRSLFFKELLSKVDSGEMPVIKQSMLNKYPSLKLPTTLKSKLKAQGVVIFKKL